MCCALQMTISDFLLFIAAKFEADDDEFDHQIKRQKYGPTSELTTKTDFPVQAWQPKVQTPYYVPPGHTPRRVEIERYSQRSNYILRWELYNYIYR